MDATKTLINKLGKDRVLLNEPLSSHCTWRVGGLAKLWYEAKTKEELIKSITLARKYQIPYFVLAGGSNVLFSDRGFDGLVIKNSTSKISFAGITGRINNQIKKEAVFIEAESGVMFNRLVRFTLDQGLTGLEYFLGQPGTVGGAVYMNAHFMLKNKFVGDYLSSAKILNNENKVTDVEASYFRFGYDQSIIQKTGEIVLSAVFKLAKSNKTSVWEAANETIAYRQKTQPQGYPTAGCTFRNISTADAISLSIPNQIRSAGFLIDQCSLKGFAIGGAEISHDHANFILNKNKATAKDIISLINLCKDKVREKFGAVLTEEITYGGF